VYSIQPLPFSTNRERPERDKRSRFFPRIGLTKRGKKFYNVDDNRLLGNASEPKMSIIKRPENVGLISNKFKKVIFFSFTR